MNRRALFALAAVAVGGGLALLSSSRAWLRVALDRPAPLPDLRVPLTGRDVAVAVAGLAVVALAGVVALLATRGVLARIVGGLLVLDGAALALTPLRFPPSAAHVRTLVGEKRVGASLAGVRLDAHPQWVWPVLVAAGGVLVLVGGALVAWRGLQWRGLGRRYDAPVAAPAEVDETRRDLALWKQLDAGDDPTADAARTRS